MLEIIAYCCFAREPFLVMKIEWCIKHIYAQNKVSFCSVLPGDPWGVWDIVEVLQQLMVVECILITMFCFF